jgi:predicted RecB family nuclease
MPGAITREVVEAYLQCRVKGHLRLSGAQGPNVDYDFLVREEDERVHLKAITRLLTRHQDAVVERKLLVTPLQLKFGASLILEALLHNSRVVLDFDGLERAAGASTLGDFHYVPVLFFGVEHIRQAHRDLLGFFGEFLGDIQGRQPNSGLMVHGRDATVTKSPLACGARRIKRLLAEIQDASQSETAPPLTLNDHCPLCEFQDRCRAQATANDDLSLLRGMSRNEIRQQNGKGIFTVTQFSYTYRPRRRNRRVKTQAFPRFFALQALAIREKKVFVRGPLSLPLPKTSIFLDIEGIPDRRFHYLAGLAVIDKGNETRYSFWADQEADQVAMFSALLDRICKYNEYTLFHYGSYDTLALKKIRNRLPVDRQEQIDDVFSRAINVLSLIHAHVYFPTYSNSLKDIGRFLGYRWSSPDASGAQSLVWRLWWEKNGDEAIKAKLLQYNEDDCLALKTLVNFLAEVADTHCRPDLEARLGSTIASVDDLPMTPERNNRFGKKAAVLPGFDYMNKCAYFDYQPALSEKTKL